MNLKQLTIVIFTLASFSFVEAQELNVEKALSLARVKKDGKTHILQVNRIDDSFIEGIDLSKDFNYYSDDIFDIIEKIGYDKIVANISTGTKVKINSSNVLTPVDAITNTIAVATNYPEHKDETNVEIDPILFPKIAQLTPYISKVKTKKEYLLDYEVELGFVYSKDVKSIEDLDNQLLGLMVVMDYSDRASQLIDYDTDHPELGVGFTDSKSHDGFFPVGPILVVPKDWKRYYKDLQIQLFRNSEIKQKDTIINMFWDIPKITEESLKLGNEKIWTLRGKPISLLPKNYIEKGTIVATGTPGGVILTTPTKGYIMRGAIKYSLLLKFFKWKPEAYVKHQFVKGLRKKDKYLKSGERVKAQISNLGYINSQIISEKE